MTKLHPLLTWRSVVVDSELPSDAKLVALALSLHMNERGGSAFPSIATLQRETSLSRAQVQKMLAQLVREGYLNRELGGGRRSSTYEARIPHPPPSEAPAEDKRRLTEAPPASPGGPTRLSDGPTVNSSSRTSLEDVPAAPEAAAHLQLVTAPFEPHRELTENGAQVLVGDWIDYAVAVTHEPVPKRVIGQTAKHVGELVKEGISAEVVARALRLMVDKRLHPASLPSLIVEAAAGPRVSDHPADVLLRGLEEPMGEEHPGGVFHEPRGSDEDD